MSNPENQPGTPVEAPDGQSALASQPTSGLAIAALVTGIVAFLSGLAPIWGLLVGAAAVALGVVALIKRQNKALSLTGLALGTLAALTSLITTVALVIGVAAGTNPNVSVPSAEEPSAIITTPSTEATEAGSEPVPDIEVEEEPPANVETVSQANARESATSYLSFMAFSRSGLIDQLKFEGYSTDDARYAVDSLNVDWNDQAAKKAQEYLDFSSFSRSGLIDQLVFEGFSNEQARFGADAVGL